MNRIDPKWFVIGQFELNQLNSYKIVRLTRTYSNMVIKSFRYDRAEGGERECGGGGEINARGRNSAVTCFGDLFRNLFPGNRSIKLSSIKVHRCIRWGCEMRAKWSKCWTDNEIENYCLRSILPVHAIQSSFDIPIPNIKGEEWNVTSTVLSVRCKKRSVKYVWLGNSFQLLNSLRTRRVLRRFPPPISAISYIQILCNISVG